MLLKDKLRHIEIFMSLLKQELILMGQCQTRSGLGALCQQEPEVRLTQKQCRSKEEESI